MANNRYAIDCSNPYDQNGMIVSLQSIVGSSDVIIVDTSVIPSVREVIRDNELDLEQAKNLSHVNKTLADILKSPKIHLYHQIRGELQFHVEAEQAASRRLDQDVREYRCYTQATEAITLPEAAPIPDGYERIFKEFYGALQFLDVDLDIRYQKEENPTPVDLYNLAYVLTLAVADPDRSHTLLTRDKDYFFLFEALIGLAYSENFSMGNKNGNTVAQKLGNPKIKITNCDERSKNQPYYVKKNSESMEIGQRYDWALWGKHLKEYITGDRKITIIKKVQQHLSRVIQEKIKLSQPKEPEPTVASVDESEMQLFYRAMRIVPEQIPQLYALGRLQEKLAGLKALEGKAKKSGAHQTLKLIQTDKKAVDEYFLRLHKEHQITEDNVSELDKQGILGKSLAKHRELEAIAKEYGISEIRDSTRKGLSIAKGYVQRQAKEIQEAQASAQERIATLTSELEELTAKHNTYRTDTKRYENLLRELEGVQPSSPRVRSEPQATRYIPQATPEPKKFLTRTPADIIYDNLCYLMDREPQEDEQIKKSILREAMCISTASFSLMVKKAEISVELIPQTRGSRNFTFKKETIDQ